MKELLDDPRVLLPLILTAAAIALGAVLIVVLSKDATASATAAPVSASAAGGAVKVQISNFKFLPATVTVKAGSKVTWVNNDSAQHTATSGSAFDTGDLSKGDSKTVTLSKPGSYAYVCQFHAFMTGTVVVK